MVVALVVAAAILGVLGGVQVPVVDDADFSGPDPPRIVAHHHDAGGYGNETLATSADVEEVSDPARSAGNVYTVGVRLYPEAGERFADRLVALGFDGRRDCDWSNRSGHCLLVVRDGEVLAARGVGPRLARRAADGEFASDPTFVFAATTESAADGIARALRYEPPRTRGSPLAAVAAAIVLGGALLAWLRARS